MRGQPPHRGQSAAVSKPPSFLMKYQKYVLAWAGRAHVVWLTLRR